MSNIFLNSELSGKFNFKTCPSGTTLLIGLPSSKSLSFPLCRNIRTCLVYNPVHLDFYSYLPAIINRRVKSLTCYLGQAHGSSISLLKAPPHLLPEKALHGHPASDRSLRNDRQPIHLRGCWGLALERQFEEKNRGLMVITSSLQSRRGGV